MESPAVDHRPSPTTPATTNDEDSLEICDPGEFLGAGKSTFDTPTEPGTVASDMGNVMGGNAPTRNTDDETGAATGEESASAKPPAIQKLSDEQVNDIRSSMMRHESDSEFATPEDASFILHNLKRSGDGPELERQPEAPAPPPVAASPDVPDTTETAAPAVDPPPESKPDMPRPVKTTPIRNIAYFHKNFIQLTGNIHPIAGEELRIDERAYVLRPKRIKTKYTITAIAMLAAVFLFIIGKQFVSPTVPGSGSVVGLILDDSGRPLAEGIKLRIPEIGKSAVSNAAGFFRFDGVETGTYIIEYSLPDGRVGSENVSVATDELTTVSMTTADAVIKSVADVSSTDTPRRNERVTGNGSRTSAPVNTVMETASTNDAVSSPKELADLKLKANVDNASLIVNGETLGRGNMTYRKLMPGTHSVTIVKDGYLPWKGKIKLRPGETYTLAVTLEKTAAESAEPEYTADDFYQSGATMLAKGDPESAIRDLTVAIDMDPSMADAYFKRAQANQEVSKTVLAESDYVQAGEIYRTQRRMSTAMDAFNRAIEINSKSVPALINRGDIYSLQDNKSAAMDDYQAAVKADQNNFQANFELGKAYFLLGKFKDADKRLRKARELNPSVPEVYHYLMLNYFARDNFKDVKKTYSDFKESVGPNEVQAFKGNPRYDAILRVIGEYDNP